MTILKNEKASFCDLKKKKGKKSGASVTRSGASGARTILIDMRPEQRKEAKQPVIDVGG